MDTWSCISRSSDSSGDSSSFVGSSSPSIGSADSGSSGEVSSYTPQDIRLELFGLKLSDGMPSLSFNCFLAKISLCWSGGILFLSVVTSLVYHVPLLVYNVTSCGLEKVFLFGSSLMKICI
ncbi:hypothetical protein FH972_026763 [Carpinus fangiana]|uniref:Uncharacterized protein n=1 Tax=Carpinus fangiana TaxID=176857 RepID=A0A5N6L4Y8_9ROSI|nr:hypothetical protein FH972_026763 [Carpinus fangiana]